MANPLGNCAGGLSAAAEEAVLALLRGRIEANAQREGGRATVAWERPERSAEREDFRARFMLGRAAADLLPSGRPWRGRVVRGRLFRRTRLGVAIAGLAPWSTLPAGEEGAIALGEAVAFYERERERWRRRFGARPFYAAVAAKFREDPGSSPVPNLALLSWQNGGWRFHGRASQPELAELFYPKPPEKTPPPGRWMAMSTLGERLISPFRNRRRAAEAKLAARTREFEQARQLAKQLHDDCALHAAAGDWGEERLQIQLARGKHALHEAALLYRQVQALQENLQLLTTARMGGALVAAAALPIEAEQLAALDRAYYTIQARRRAAVQAERTLSETLLSDDLQPAAVLGETEAASPPPPTPVRVTAE